MNRSPGLRILGQPDPASPKDVHLVGRYALGVDWSHGHGSIFPFEALRRGCACGACGALETVAAAAAWPRAINRTDGGLTVTWADGHTSLYPWADVHAACRCAACTGGH